LELGPRVISTKEAEELILFRSLRFEVKCSVKSVEFEHDMLYSDSQIYEGIDEGRVRYCLYLVVRSLEDDLSELRNLFTKLCILLIEGSKSLLELLGVLRALVHVSYPDLQCPVFLILVTGDLLLLLFQARALCLPLFKLAIESLWYMTTT
jgi:hypothetical protein